MRFHTDIATSAIPGLLERLMNISGVEPWVKRFEWLEREGTDNPYMREWLQQRFSIELALLYALSQRDSTVQAGARYDGMYELAAFTAGFVSIYDQVSAAAQTRLRGQLIDGLKSDTGLLSLQLEVATATHLVRAGYEVEPHDLEAGGGFDFLASRAGREIEVECKLLSGDIGRKIHKRQFARLAHALTPILEQLFRTTSCGLLVRITLPDRLTPAHGHHEAIVRSVAKGILGGRGDVDVCGVQLIDFNFEGSPFAAGLDARVRRKDVQAFAARVTGRSNANVMALVSPGQRVAVLVLESSQPDSVLKGIRRQLRDAARGQLTGTRPGCLIAALHDISDEQMLALARLDSTVRAGATGLQVMTSDLLQAASRAHVHSVVYRGRNRLPEPNAHSVMGEGYSYVMKNARHPLADDPHCNLFGSEKIKSDLITPG